MMRKVIALFDEYQSKENAKHVIRSMKENARQGFWNGATPPLGYRLIEAEKRGAKIKKKLEVDPVEAETVRLIFKLYLLGDGNSGALGVKEIVKWLNGRGHRTRRGKSFGVGQLHKLLTNTVYIGRWKFNQTSSKTRMRKADEEVVEIPVPAIIELDTFGQVQRQLHARSPKRQAPRVTTGPILLTGLAVCATCRGGMMLRTGTSKGGRVYRYYTCSNCATKGKTACKGRSIPMDKLDGMVTDHLLERLFKPERIALILASLSSRRSELAAAVNTRMSALQREVVDAEDRLKRLYRLVEDGLDVDEVLKERLTTLKADRDRAKAALERAREQSASQIQINPALIERFGRTCARTSPRARCRSERPTFDRSSMSSKLMTTKYASRALRRCSKRRSSRANIANRGVRRRVLGGAPDTIRTWGRHLRRDTCHHGDRRALLDSPGRGKTDPTLIRHQTVDSGTGCSAQSIVPEDEISPNRGIFCLKSKEKLFAVLALPGRKIFFLI
jgi:DNA invertase Pin-like site-specific DNA recombinase